jgi:hypothetical protein
MSNLLEPIDESQVDYNRDKTIDVNKLHEEWLRQPGLCGDYNKILAQAEERRDRVKKKIEICKANLAEQKAILDLMIRKKPEDYDPPINKKGEISTTEAWFVATLLIESKGDEGCVKAAEELSQAQEELIKADLTVAIYNAGVKMIVDKKTSLQNEVDLWTRGYYSVPNLPKPLPEEYINAQELKREDVVAAQRERIQPPILKKDELSPGAGGIVRRRRGV